MGLWNWILGLVVACLAACVSNGLVFGNEGEVLAPLPVTEDHGEKAGNGGAVKEEAGGFVGSVGCRGCHGRFYALWSGSHHGLAMRPYGDGFAAERLTEQVGEIVVRGRGYRAEIGVGQGWVLERDSARQGLVLEQDGTERDGAERDRISERDGEVVRKLAIAHVLGGKNVFYFLTPGDGGRLQTLPVAYDVNRKEWFDAAGSAVRHFPMGADSPAHWSEREYTFNSACYSCHVSQLATNYEPKSDSYRTVWGEPGINCETCHGPAGEHVRVCVEAEKKKEVSKDLKIVTVTQSRGYSGERVDSNCAACHAQMMPITDSYRPGDRFFDHYGLTTLEDEDFYPDGRDLGENYTYTLWLMSPCVRSGKLDCMHCHTSSGRFRFVDEPNRACLPCHKERVGNAAAHTHHAEAGKGNQCIGCHMPMTEFARMRRSDHSMLPPTPAATLKFESPNACNICHADKDAAWADGQVRKWHEDDYQRLVLERAALIDAARKEDWSKVGQMLAYLKDGKREDVFAASLVKMLWSCPDERVDSALIAALKDRSALVRAAAAESLAGRLTREVVTALLAATRDEYRLVRVRAAASLAGVPAEVVPSDTDRASLVKATAEYEASLRCRPDDPMSHFNRGNFHLQRGEIDQALECFKRANKLDPRIVDPLVNMAIAFNMAGRNDEAEAALRRAKAIDPSNVAVNVNLGMLLVEMDRLDEAKSAFLAACNADHSPVAAYNLAILVADEQPEEAIRLCRRAAELQPEVPKYSYTLAYYLHRNGRAEEAETVLRETVVRHGGHAESVLLLGEMLEEQKRWEEAAEVYRRALASDEIAAPYRMHLESRLETVSSR